MYSICSLRLLFRLTLVFATTPNSSGPSPRPSPGRPEEEKQPRHSFRINEHHSTGLSQIISELAFISQEEMILFCFQKFKANKLLVAAAAAHHASDEGLHLRKWPSWPSYCNLIQSWLSTFSLAMATHFQLATNTSGGQSLNSVDCGVGTETFTEAH
jgi:hypothetical protein